MTDAPTPPTPSRFSRRSLMGLVPAIAGGATVTAAGTGAAHAAAGRGPVAVCYVEVNNHDLNNVGKYVLSGTSTPVYDVAIIFAANINYDGTRAYLHLNDRVTATLADAANQIRPLQAKGIKVVLSVLGNHQGAGFANFPSQSAADAFATQLANVVTQYGLDGIDFDDEYADYGANGTGQPNASSFVHLVTALRRKLGSSKLITLYDIGPSAQRTEYDGVQLGATFTYAWNPYYGSWQVPSVPGMTKPELSPAAVQVGATSTSTAAYLAQRTRDEGYGVFMTYDLDGTDRASYLSSFTRPLYGLGATYTG